MLSADPRRRMAFDVCYRASGIGIFREKLFYFDGIGAARRRIALKAINWSRKACGVLTANTAMLLIPVLHCPPSGSMKNCHAAHGCGRIGSVRIPPGQSETTNQLHAARPKMTAFDSRTPLPLLSKKPVTHTPFA